MSYRGVVKGDCVVFEHGIKLPEGTPVDVTPIAVRVKGTPSALLEVWGSDVPDEAWDAVETAVAELDHADREYERRATDG